MDEIWKDIEGYEGLYQVSNLGRVKAVSRLVENNGGFFHKEERILKLGTNHKGYKTVYLSKKCQKYTAVVHRLVAKAFIPNLNNKETINHINEVKSDNRVSNLEWMSNSENVKYGTGAKRSAKSRINNEKRCKKILQFLKTGQIVAEFSSLKEASNCTGISKGNICECCNDRRTHAGGFIWKYKKRGD